MSSRILFRGLTSNGFRLVALNANWYLTWFSEKYHILRAYLYEDNEANNLSKSCHGRIPTTRRARTRFPLWWVSLSSHNSDDSLISTRESLVSTLAGIDALWPQSFPLPLIKSTTLDPRVVKGWHLSLPPTRPKQDQRQTA